MVKKILFGVVASLTMASSVFAYSPNTLWEYFNGRLPSIEKRTWLAEQCGISNYSANYQQNVDLLNCLKDEDNRLSNEFLLEAPEGELIGAGYLPVTGYQSRTTSYISSSAATIPVVSTKDKAGNQIDLTNISASGTVRVYMNLEPGTTREEPVVCTGLTATTWTGCTRGLSFQGTSETSSTTIAVAHNAGAPIIITNIAQFFNQYVSIDGAQLVNGLKTFSTLPYVPVGTPTDGREVVSWETLQNIVVSGAPTSTESVTGITQLGTQVEMASSTFNALAPTVLYTQYSTSTPGSAGLWAVVSENDGKISQSWLDLSENYTWTGTHSFVTSTITTSTINTLNIGSKPANNLVNGSNADTLHIHTLDLVTTTAAQYTSTTSSGLQTWLSFTLPGNTLESGNAIRITAYISDFDQQNNEWTTSTLKYGGQTVAQGAIKSAGGGALSNDAGVIEFMLLGAGGTSVQKGVLKINISDPTYSSSAAHANYIYTGSGTVDSTSDQTMLVQFQFASNATQNAVTVEAIVVEKIQYSH